MKEVTATISISGCACLMAAIASRPPISGISRSIRITSGSEAVGGGHALAPVLGLTDHVEVLEQLQEPAQAAPHDGVVVDQQHPDRAFFVSHRLDPLPLSDSSDCAASLERRAGSMHQREHAFGLRHVAQALRAEVAQERARRQRAVQLVDGASGEERLAALRQCLEARRPEQRAAVVAVAPLLDVAAHHGDPDAHAADRAPVVVGDRRLHVVGGRNRGERIGEAGVGAVTDPLEQPARRAAAACEATSS